MERIALQTELTVSNRLSRYSNIKTYRRPTLGDPMEILSLEGDHRPTKRVYISFI